MCDAEGGQSVGLPAAASQREMMCEREVFDTFPLFVISKISLVLSDLADGKHYGEWNVLHVPFLHLDPSEFLPPNIPHLAGTALVGHTTHQV